MAVKLAVLSPAGYPPEVTAQGMAPSPGDLEGKTVFLVDVGFENSDNFVAQLHAWFSERRPEIRTRVVRWRDEYQPDPELCQRIEAEADAAILAVGT